MNVHYLKATHGLDLPCHLGLVRAVGVSTQTHNTLYVYLEYVFCNGGECLRSTYGSMEQSHSWLVELLGRGNITAHTPMKLNCPHAPLGHTSRARITPFRSILSTREDGVLLFFEKCVSFSPLLLPPPRSTLLMPLLGNETGLCKSSKNQIPNMYTRLG